MRHFHASTIRTIGITAIWSLLACAPLWAKGREAVHKPGARAEAVAAKIQSGKVGDELRALRVPAHGTARSALLGIRQHANDASGLNWHEQRSVRGAEAAPKLTDAAVGAVCEAVHPMKRRGHGKKAHRALMSTLGKGQRRLAIASLQDRGRFRSAAWLAESVLDEETNASDGDLLRLAVARCEFIGRAGGLTAKARKHLDGAVKSKDKEVARRARLLKEAIEGPRSIESLELCHQIWKTVHGNLGQRGKSGTMMMRAVETGPALLERLRQSQLPQKKKEAQLARAVAILSEAAFQTGQEEPLLMCIQTAEGLKYGAADDRLAPHYFYGLHLYGQGMYRSAICEFEAAFFSGEACDMAADAGRRLAVCYTMLHDREASLACMQLVVELYPDQVFVTRPIQDVLRTHSPSGLKQARQRSEEMYSEKTRRAFEKRQDRKTQQ